MLSSMSLPLSELINSVRASNPAIPIHNYKLLLAHILSCSITELVLVYNQLNPDQYNTFIQMTQRLNAGEPLQYIIGSAPFFGLELIVNPAVLIPRPETEGLVELCLAQLSPKDRILDIGTGSGAIAIAIKVSIPSCHVSGTDISEAALQVASANCAKYSTGIDLYHCDLFPPEGGVYDLIVSNPPYIRIEDYNCLPMEVKDHEPVSALLAEENGLAFYRRILDRAKSFRSPKRLIAFEIGETQASDIAGIASQCGYKRIKVFPDLCQKDRYMLIYPD